MSRARRRDPDRKQRILQAAVEVIAEHGLPRTTHRLIAATADVPLGSLTYHFSTLDDLCRQGFEQYAARLSTTYAAYFEAISTREQLIDAVTDLTAVTRARVRRTGRSPTSSTWQRFGTRPSAR
ncbi:MAG: TetR/AcrR family transcriptional regulator [Nocardioidaceae bacterium]